VGRWHAARAVTVVVAVLVVTARIWLFVTGRQYGASAERAWNLVVAAAIGLMVLTWSQARAARRHAAGEVVEVGSVVAGASAALAFAAAAVGSVSLIVPSTPTQAAAPACEGAPVYGARFFAQTVQELGGVNARSGPGTSHPQVNRFSGGCTLGFDGYCIGEPIGDFRVLLGKEPWPDQRWLIVHRRAQLVASAKVQSQSKEAALGDQPDPRCAGWGGRAQPKIITFTVTPSANGRGLAGLQAQTTGAVVVGYAVRLLTTPVDAVDPYGPIGAKSNAPGFSARWAPSVAAAHLPGRSGEVQVAAVVCLAAGVPDRAPSVVRVRLSRGAVVAVRPDTVDDMGARQQLGYTACAGPS